MDADFEATYRDHGGALHAYLARLTGDRWAAEELCQETFVRYLRHRAALTGANGSLAAWLFRVATNLARDRARRNARPLPPPPEPGPGGNEMAEAREVHERVRAEVERLPVDLREVFLLRAHHELPYAKVALALDVSERTAKQRFRLAREILAHRLDSLIREDPA